jgi:hypothetical protein
VLLDIALLWFSYYDLHNHSVAEAQQETIAAALREPECQGRRNKLELLKKLNLLVQVDVPRDVDAGTDESTEYLLQRYASCHVHVAPS